MDMHEYTLEEISFSRKEDCRVLESVLNNWLSKPKILNYVEPKLNFPFKFKKWLSIYKNNKTNTFIIKKENWIIGYISIRISNDKNQCQLFHLFIDKSFRNNNLAQLLITKSEEFGKSIGMKIFTAELVTKNLAAINLFEKLGYKEKILKSHGYIKMVKVITKPFNS